MSIIDTHCHLGADYEKVLKRAANVGVSHVINICIHPEDIVRAETIIKEFPNAPFAAGIHPCHAHEVVAGHFETVCRLAEEKKLIAIGETGLDLYHSVDHFDLQKKYFREHIHLANRHKIPLSIHCRNAYKELMEFVDQHPIEKGILHCFAGSQEVADWAIKKGFYLSISGVVTFKNARELQQIVSQVPLNRLLIETDAPYLAPDPYRGKTNEPTYLPWILRKIANLVGKEEAEVEQILFENSKQLFMLV